MKFLFRLIMPIFIFSFFLTRVLYSQEHPEFNKGVESYSAGNYGEALKAWLDIYKSGYQSANLNYNIGNAYFKLGDVPNSILFYERAYLLDPSDDNINYNLEIARTLTVDRFQEIPELFFVKWFNLVSLSMKGNTWSVISVSSFILCLILLSFFIYSSDYNIKVLSFWLAIVLFVISISTLFFAVQNGTLVHDSHKAIITMPQVSGKSSPDDSGTDLFVIHEGTKVTVGDEVGNWYEIILSDGNKGWIPVNSLSII